jgi:hypothetical protein
MLPFNVNFFWDATQWHNILKFNIKKSLVFYDKIFKNAINIIKIAFDWEPFIKKDSKKLKKKSCVFNNHIFKFQN